MGFHTQSPQDLSSLVVARVEALHRQPGQSLPRFLHLMGVAVKRIDFSRGPHPFRQKTAVPTSAQGQVHQNLPGLGIQPFQHFGRQNRHMLFARPNS